MGFDGGAGGWRRRRGASGGRRRAREHTGMGFLCARIRRERAPIRAVRPRPGVGCRGTGLERAAGRAGRRCQPRSDRSAGSASRAATEPVVVGAGGRRTEPTVARDGSWGPLLVASGVALALGVAAITR